MITLEDTTTRVKEAAGTASRPATGTMLRARGPRQRQSAGDLRRRRLPPPRRPARAGRNYTLLTAAAVVTNLGSQGALIA